MSSATCPHCQDPVMVPAGADPESIVRCPLCDEEFQLSVVLETMPPQLIVVGGGESAGGAAAGTVERLGDERPAFLATPGDGGDESVEELRLAADEDDAGEPAHAFQFEGSSDDSPAGGSTGTATATVRSTRGGKAKSKKSPAMEMVKIALGGIVGLTIGYVLLWWILTAMGRRPQDPVGVAPAISRFVPWIVPAPLRGASPADDDTSGGSGFDDAAADADWTGHPGDGPGVVPAPSRGPGRPGAVAGSDAAGGAGFGGAGFGGEDAGAPTPSQGVPEMDVPEFDVPEIDVPGIDVSGSDPSAAGSDAASNSLDRAAIVADPLEITASQFQQRLEEVRISEGNWESAEEGARAREAIDFYKTLGALGEAVTFADQTDLEIQGSLAKADQWIQELAGSPAKVEALGTLGSKWLRSENRTNRGVLLEGTVQSVSAGERYFEIRLALPAGQQPEVVSIISLNDPRPAAAAGARLLVLGAILTDPAANLARYQGGEERVVLNGRLARLP